MKLVRRPKYRFLSVMMTTVLAAGVTLGCSGDDSDGSDDDDSEQTNEDAGPNDSDAGPGDEGNTGSDDSGAGPDGADAGPGAEDMVELSVRLYNLEPLGGDFEYEGWLVIDGTPVSTGRFNIEEGETDYTFEVPASYQDDAEAFVLSIEPPAADDDPEPAPTKVLGGELDDGSADLALDFGAALATDFADMEGYFFLETPTSAEADDYDQGIWFFDNRGDDPAAGLVLPELPEGWAYEGWVVGDDGPVSTGRFTTAEGADSDEGGPAAGDEDAPPFPGQDFIDPAMSLSGNTVVISVEPMPDDSEAPFALKPLYSVADQTEAGELKKMDNQSATNNAQGLATFGELPAKVETETLSVRLNNLEPLAGGFEYEGWVVVDGAPVSTGRFNIEDGVTDYTFEVPAVTADEAEAFVLSIEPPVAEDDPAPAPTKVLGGALEDGSGALGLDFGAALGTDFADMEGYFFLQTPTSAAADDYDLGIWFFDNTVPAAGLVLPELPEGWAYEGWVVGDDGPVSTGRFTMAVGADSDEAGPAAGDERAPPFPGQDFIDPAMSLRGHTVVISVEPMPDDSEAPFALKPLISVADQTAAGELKKMINQTSRNNSTGYATFGELPELATVEVSLEGLEPLAGGFEYEGWVVVEDTPVSTGRFNVVADQTDYSFTIPQETAEAAGAFVLTIEPPIGLDDPAPADTKVLGGAIADRSATLGVDFGAALATDFADATGYFFLETPTTAAVAEDYDKGIWFINEGAAGLDLPALPAGWEYEGWVVVGDAPISTGRFGAGDAADSDGAGPTAGPDAAPPFPGQDFITDDPAISLTGATVVVSVEPSPDDSAAPFALKPLVGTADQTAAGVSKMMTNQSDTNNPSGTVAIQ